MLEAIRNYKAYELVKQLAYYYKLRMIGGDKLVIEGKRINDIIKVLEIQLKELFEEDS